MAIPLSTWCFISPLQVFRIHRVERSQPDRAKMSLPPIFMGLPFALKGSKPLDYIPPHNPCLATDSENTSSGKASLKITIPATRKPSSRSRNASVQRPRETTLPRAPPWPRPTPSYIFYRCNYLCRIQYIYIPSELGRQNIFNIFRTPILLLLSKVRLGCSKVISESEP